MRSPFSSISTLFAKKISAAIRRSKPDTHQHRSTVNHFNSIQFGSIYIVFEPEPFINDFDGLNVTALAPIKNRSLASRYRKQLGKLPRNAERRCYYRQCVPTPVW